ncbi:MAG: nicotinate-nucleotide--dimethylbenzimidazole phosphoribosyltransferase [Chloroflexota bacterium]
MTIPPKLPAVPPLDAAHQTAALERQGKLTKPSGALGKLEILSAQLAGMTQQTDWLPKNPVVIVCAGDHGIAEQGVSAYPRSVTKQMVMNFLNGGAAINVLARQMNVNLTVVDAGVAGILPEHEMLVAGKINYGTADFSKGAAMSLGHADQAIQLGLRVVNEHIDAGAGMVLTGEMGIGNTSSAAALIAAVTNAPVEKVTGRGTGISQDQFSHKIDLIQQALTLHTPVHVDTLAKFGGYEIAALVGVMVGAAARRVPVVLDGVITAAAALIAAKLVPNAVNYFIAGHRGVEPGHGYALQALGLTPVLELSMRLGEGTGAVLALPVIEAAMRTLQEMSTFGEAGVSGPDGND